MKEALQVLMVVVIMSAIGYTMYWVGKKVSYSIAYEDMVRETVKEMVKEGSLK